MEAGREFDQALAEVQRARSSEEAERALADPVRAGWLEVLARHSWDWFATLTFRGSESRGVRGAQRDVHPEAAHKVFKCWLNLVNRKVYGRRWYRKCGGVTWVRAMEWQKRGVLHFHVLLAGVPDEVRRLRAMDEWFQLAGIARIEPIESQRVVELYVSKYVAKSQEEGRRNEYGKLGGALDVGGSGFEDGPLVPGVGRVPRDAWSYGLAGAAALEAAAAGVGGYQEATVCGVRVECGRLDLVAGRRAAEAASCDVQGSTGTGS